MRAFETVEELRLALIARAELYDEQLVIEYHGFRSRGPRRRDYYAAAQSLPARRRAVYPEDRYPL